MLTRAELLVLNRVISLIYSVEDLDSMRRRSLTALQPLIWFTSAEIHLKSSGEHLIDGGVGVGKWTEEVSKEYFEKFEKIDYARWVFSSTRSTIIRESDMFEDAEREKTPYYQGFMKKHNFHYCMQASIVKNDEFLGLVALYRDKDTGDFDEKDRFVLDLLIPHLENRLKGDYQTSTSQQFDELNYMKEYSLTQREIEVLALLMEGLSNEEICERLAVTIHTLNKHTASIYSKLGISHRWELIKFK